MLIAQKVTSNMKICYKYKDFLLYIGTAASDWIKKSNLFCVFAKNIELSSPQIILYFGDFLKMIDNQIVTFYYFHIITVSNYLIIKSRKKIVFEFFPKI
jgi:hypothetical protein